MSDSGHYPEIGLSPFKIVKTGPLYKKSEVTAACLKMVNTDYPFFNKKAKAMTTDVEKAIEKTTRVTSEFSLALDRLYNTEKQFAEESKRISGSVRAAGEKLAQGLAKVEKAANFDRLERYVVLLERAAAAMTTLAELEQSGKLEKIAGAIR